MQIKRSVAGLLVALTLALCACSVQQHGSGAASEPGAMAGGLDPAHPVTLNLWHYYVGENQQALEAAASLFNQTVGIENGVIVYPVAKGGIQELEEAVTDSAMGVINSDPMPELFSSYPDKAMEIDALGMLCDLNAYFTEAEQQLYVPGFLADGVFGEGRLLVLPIVKSTELLYVNATAWKAFADSEGYTEADLATWEKVYDTARAYYEWTDAQTADTLWDGKGLMGFDSLANFVIISNKQLGVDVIDADGRQAVLNKMVMRRIFDFYYTGMSLGYLDAVGAFRSDDIKTGDLVAYVGSSSGAAYFPTWIERNNTQETIDFLPLGHPAFEGGTPYAIQQGAGMCMSLSTPQKQEGAALFLKWFTAAQQNIAFAMTTGYLPVQTDAYNSEAFNMALASLHKGDAARQNVAGVYEIALHQITEANTYAARPFAGSYDVRGTLQATLLEAGNAGRQRAAPLKAQGLDEAMILQQLDVDARFEEWLARIRAELDALEIAYTG